ncbi:hypothetical protein EV646_101838 [Kribbella antiqua]|uniref:DNA-binding protein n=1 Tax=Kribbella antiqua TaxID=2512217 RepID=A0A4R2J393_9ACTN|nr:hypothetical protein [Kribbella antiqua]TCO51842.1 hypothetical protein EV646_101838 [Kribbella antiqua]
MQSNYLDGPDDQAQARREHEARALLLDRGADQLARRPWQRGAMPPSAVDLIQFVLWRSSGAAPDKDLAVAGLRLLAAARAELEQLETGLMFTARGLGLTWAEMARALGLNSPQACQQRLDRLAARSSTPGTDA